MKQRIVCKVIIYVLITYSLTAVLVLTQQRSGLSHEIISLPQLAPTLGYAIVACMYKDLRIVPRVLPEKSVWLKALIALLLPTVLFTMVFFISQLTGGITKSPGNFISFVSTMIPGILLGSAGEELGRRNFLQPTLERRFSTLWTSVIVGVVWGLWHVGHYKNGIGFMVGFLIFTISASIILALLNKKTGYNLIVSAIFHATINICFLFFFVNSQINPTFRT